MGTIGQGHVRYEVPIIFDAYLELVYNTFQFSITDFSESY